MKQGKKTADIIISKGLKIQTPARQIGCNPGDSWMNCGNCGKFDFRVAVKPRNGTAKVSELICVNCGKNFKLDPQARLGGGFFSKRTEGV